MAPTYYAPKGNANPETDQDLEDEGAKARIRFEDHEIEAAPRDDRSRPRSRSRRGLSRASSQNSRRRSLSAGVPIEFRTLSIGISESKGRGDINEKDQLELDYFAKLDFHTIGADEVLKHLQVEQKHGLTNSAAAANLQRDGPNTLPKVRDGYFLKLFWYLFGGFCSILWFGVLVFFLCWRPLSSPPSIPNLALAILVIIVILLQASFSAFQDWSTTRTMNSILDLVPSEAMVVRDGNASKIPAAELVAGDIVQISIGNKVPADLRLLSTSGDIRFDRSVLTGEPDEIEGAIDCTNDNFLESRNIALMGTNVTNGNGTGVVVLTGRYVILFSLL